MSSAWSQLEQMLTCAICLDKFKNPRLLPCQHSFCGDACMEGLVDYARRQIKCPECRAEHRIPYQGVQSLPSNVTLIRFLELHSRITGEEPEPVPTFMEKCSVCGEKVDGVQRCSHCEKKVCPECKEAHIDLLRREINRINGQSKRCLSKIQEFKEILAKAEERLAYNQRTVRGEIQESCRRLMEDLKAKQAKLLKEVDSYVENEQSTLDKLKLAIGDELEVLESNSRLADEKVANNKLQWNDQELWEMKEIYAKAMEFVRLFDPDIGDFNRKIRFNLVPEFETMRRRICELGELKFGETADSLIASSFQYCNATGQLAIELCQKAAAQTANAQSANGGYGLAPSSSNTNLGGTNSGGSTLLELPGSMQNALMRSQSDHRLASQFQQRLKQQQADAASAAGKNSVSGYGAAGSRYGGASSGGGGGAKDYETDALRSRYAPPRASVGSAKDYANDLLTRDWPRPSDNDSSDMPSFGSSIHFKSAFMRRKEKERHLGGSAYGADDDDDLASEASYGGMSSVTSGGGGGRNVRFYDQQAADQQGAGGQAASRPKLFDLKDVEHAPMSGVPRLEACPHLLMRLHQMGAKAIVDKKQAEEDGKRDKDLIESARQAMTKASERSKLAQRQMSEDEIEKQKRANRQRGDEQVATPVAAIAETPDIGSGTDTIRRGTTIRQQHQQESLGGRQSPSESQAAAAAAPVAEAPTVARTESAATNPATPPSPATSVPGGRRGLYGQAVTEKSRRQLSSAIQDAAAYSLRRTTGAAASSSAEGEQTPDTSVASSASATRPKRTLRSSGRSISKQSSVDGGGTDGGGGGSGSTSSGRRRRLTRAETSQIHSSASIDSQAPTTPQLNDTPSSKNYATGSGGHSDTNNSQASRQGSLMADKSSSSSTTRRHLDQTSTTTDDEAEPAVGSAQRRQLADEEERKPKTYQPSSRYSRAQTADDDSDSSDDDDDDNDNDDDDDDNDDDDGDDDESNGARNKGNRRSREMLPNAVNKLLDRSAQIRRDSQEQRSRGDSPQRTFGSRSAAATTTTSSRDYPAPAQTQSSYYSPRSTSTAASSTSATPSYSSTAATRQRLAYQRSQSIRDNDNNDDASKTNSNNSIYTTASSTTSAGRRSDDDNLDNLSSSRRTSGSDRTVIGSRPSYRRDSSGDSPSISSATGGYQSRFLSRSRTSAALSSPSTSTSSFNNRSQDQQQQDSTSSDHHHHHHHQSSYNPEPRSYLSSRDRFMQSTDSSGGGSGYGPSRTSASTSRDAAAASVVASSADPTSSSVVAPAAIGHGLGLSRHPRSYYSSNDNTPFMDFDDDDDQYGVYLPSATSGFSAHSEYLRNKFARQRSSSNSSNSSAALLSRSKSSHAAFVEGTGNHSDNSESDSDDNNKSDNKEEPVIGRGSIQRSQDTTAASFESSSSAYNTTGAGEGGIYSGKRRLLFKLGSRGSQPGNFTWPRGVAVGQGANGGREIVVADSSNHRVQVFDSDGRFLNEFGSYGSAPGEFDCLAGVAINRLSKSYVVSDRYNHRIQVFDMAASGKFVRSFGEHGNASGKFNLPWGVACDNSSGLIYVCDKENHRIQVFDMEGNYLNKFGSCGSGPGQLQHPHYISVGLGRVVVTDTNNHRVQVFDLEGRPVSSFGKEGSGAGQFKFPRGVAMDESGNAIVGDSGNNRLQIFSPDGAYIKSIGTWGSADGEFKGIEGVAVDSAHNILVCDRENHRIQVF